jgi:chemotaxis protein histidine kinase CheA
MVAARQILTSFLVDAMRMSDQARECVRQLMDQAEKGRVSPSQVRSLFQIIHTLKGSSSMIPGGEGVVAALEKLESRLTCQSLIESARNPDWVELAHRSVAQAHSALLVLQSKDRLAKATAAATPGGETARKGLLVEASLRGATGRLWFPLHSITRVLARDEFAGREKVSVQGAWVPVISGAEEPAFAVSLQTEAGNAVLAVREILAIISWDDAREQGARQGLRHFSAAAAAA